MRLPASLALTLAFTLSPLAQAAGSDPVLAQADQLLAQHQAQAAFDLLAPLEDQRAGDPGYDYLLGLAALESGHGGMAAFAFERCLATDPKNGPCRVQMARTHLALGENGSAREELEAVQASNPPAEVSAMVSQYLGTVTSREAAKKNKVDFHAQLGGGYDTNVSSTTAETQIALPRFPGLVFNLKGVSTKQEDSFYQAEAGGSVDHGLSPAWRLLADANIATRQYGEVDTFSSRSADASIGVARIAGPDSVLAKLQAQDYELNDAGFRSLYGALLQYQHAWTEKQALAVYGQYSELDNHYFLASDAKRYTVGLGYSQALDLGRAATVYAGAYAGRESPTDTGLTVGQDFQGIRLGGNVALLQRLALTASLSVEQRKFNGLDATFLVYREDTATDLNLGAIYQLSKNLSLRPGYTYSNNDSNTVLSDFDRHVVSLDLRYDL